MAAIATSTPDSLINNKREIRGWAMYDWANSAFSTTIGAVFLGPYLSALIEAAAVSNIDEIARHHVSNSVPKTVGACGFHASSALKPLVGALLRGIVSIENVF